MFGRAIHWFRRDLRIADNTALVTASRECESLIPVYVLSEWKRSHRWTGRTRRWTGCC